MPADIFYAMGSTHHVCQDFAISNTTYDRQTGLLDKCGDYVILSDGCSSADDSDWGARLLVKACQNIIKQRENPTALDFPVLSSGALMLAASYVKMLGLNTDCLAATLLCAYKTEKSINAFITGDGYVIARSKKYGNYYLYGHVFESGAPYYLYYSLNEELRKSYYEVFGKSPAYVETSIIGKETKGFNKVATLEEMKFTTYTFPTEEYDMVAITSDGLKTFSQQVKTNTSIQNKSIDYVGVLKELLDYKGTTGKFVHRRCQKLMRDYAADGIKHTDDFSMGVVHV